MRADEGLDEKLASITSWLDSEIEAMVSMPVINAIPELAPGKGQHAAEIVNFGYLRMLRTLRDILPSIVANGYVGADEIKLVNAIHMAMRRNNVALPPAKKTA